MRRLVIVMCTLLISSAAFAANVLPTRSADQSRPSKSAALIAARLPTLKAFIAHCEQDFDLQGNPIMVDGLPTFTCWYEMDMPSDGGPCMGGFTCDGNGFGSGCFSNHTTPYSGCYYPGDPGYCDTCS